MRFWIRIKQNRCGVSGVVRQWDVMLQPVEEDWHSPAHLAPPSGPWIPACTEVRDTWLACVIGEQFFVPNCRFIMCRMPNNEPMLCCKTRHAARERDVQQSKVTYWT